MGVALPRLLYGSKLFAIFNMLVSTIAYTMQKEAGKNIGPSFFNNLVWTRGRGPATPFWAVRHARNFFQN